MFFALPMFHLIVYLECGCSKSVESTMKSGSNPVTGNADKKIHVCKVGIISRLLKSFDGALKCGAFSFCPFSVAF